MSVITIITPIITASWPILAPAIISAASTLGFSLVKADLEERKREKTKKNIEKNISIIELENSKVINESIPIEGSFKLNKEGITVTFSKNLQGKLNVRVEGQGIPQEKLKEIGSKLVSQIVQRYVYNKVINELKRQNYSIIEQEIKPDNTIRILVRKWT